MIAKNTLSARSRARIETRENIIKNCAALMAERGYCSVSIPEIEKVTGKTKAILYGYFNNRQELAMAVLDYALEQNRNLINDFVSAAGDNRSMLIAHIQFQYPKTEYAFVGNGNRLFSLAIEAESMYEEMRKRVAKALLLWRDDLVVIIESGITASEFKKDKPADDIAWQLISLIESAVIISKNTQNRKLGIKLLDQAVTIVRNL